MYRFRSEMLLLVDLVELACYGSSYGWVISDFIGIWCGKEE